MQLRLFYRKMNINRVPIYDDLDGMGIGKRRTDEQRLAWNLMRSAQAEGADLREHRQRLERELAKAARLRAERLGAGGVSVAGRASRRP
jgi:hypothetical protein